MATAEIDSHSDGEAAEKRSVFDSGLWTLGKMTEMMATAEKALRLIFPGQHGWSS